MKQKKEIETMSSEKLRKRIPSEEERAYLCQMFSRASRENRKLHPVFSKEG